MKFSRTLAAITAAAMAVTMAAIPASAAGTVNGAAELKVPVSNFLPEGCDYSQIYGVEITVDEATQTAIADAIEAGHNAGGGLIFNNNVTSWNQAEWALVPDAPEKDLYDAETGTFTRLDAELPFGEDPAAVEYAEVVFVCWWANDGAEEEPADIDINFQITGIKFLDAEGNYLVADTADDEEVPGDSEEVPGESEEVPGGDEGDDENTGDEGDDENTGDEGDDENTGDEGDENVGGDDEEETPGESSGEPTNPDTGVALVVVPAALAAAALATSGIALKKRSK